MKKKLLQIFTELRKRLQTANLMSNIRAIHKGSLIKQIKN